MTTNGLFGAAALGGANALITILNMSDKVQNPLALAGSAGIDALVDGDFIDDDQKQWARVLRVLLKAVAYYDADQGLSSVFQADSSPSSPSSPSSASLPAV